MASFGNSFPTLRWPFRFIGSRSEFHSAVRFASHFFPTTFVWCVIQSESSGVANAILADGFVSQFRERPGRARPPLKLNPHVGRLLSTSADCVRLIILEPSALFVSCSAHIAMEAARIGHWTKRLRHEMGERRQWSARPESSLSLGEF